MLTAPLITDIETGPLPREQLDAIAPKFDSENVAVGNLRDPDKIAAKMSEARERWYEKAALSPVTGHVLAIGYMSPETGKFAIEHGKPEEELIAGFWRKYGEMRNATRKIVGFNIFDFDLPFLVRRSWKRQIDVPASVFNGRYFDSAFLDLREKWLCGQHYSGVESSLDHVARALGVGNKPEGISGADFGRLYQGTAAERQQALDYLANDLKLTASIAARLGVV